MRHPIPLLIPGRRALVLNALTLQNGSLSIDELREKYCRMAASSFAFYRGTAHLFWADFANDWRRHQFGSRRTRTWLQGDAHAENMGAFNDQDGELVYGLNDFDESVIGDYQYDLWRFAISLVLVERRNGRLPRGEAAKVIDQLGRGYLQAMDAYASGAATSERSFTLQATTGLLKEFMVATEADKSRKRMLKKWTNKDGNSGRLFDLKHDKLEAASKFETSDVIAAMREYGSILTGSIDHGEEILAVRDVARRKSAGTGSLGTPRYYVLIQGGVGPSSKNRILDVKRQGKPSAYDYFSKEEQVDYDRTHRNDAERHARAYNALSMQPDAFLGWLKLHNGFYSVRERSPFKETFPTDTLTEPAPFIEMARTWGEILATYHVRGATDLELDDEPYSIADEVHEQTIDEGSRNAFLAMVRDYAFEYANQVDADYQHFLSVIDREDCDDFE